jgi:phosphatidylglycerol:prolipoprotein diacylglycerol transferase
LPLADKVPLEAWYNISTSQFISICMFSAGAIILYRGGKHVFFPARMTAAAASA